MNKKVDASSLRVLPNINSKGLAVLYDGYCVKCPCPVRTEIMDFGTIKIELVPNKYLLEIRSFLYYLEQFGEMPLLSEDLVMVIYTCLSEILGPTKLRVTGTFVNLMGHLQHSTSTVTVTVDSEKLS